MPGEVSRNRAARLAAETALVRVVHPFRSALSRRRTFTVPRAISRSTFDECEALGAVNLPGTGFASRDVGIRELRARVGDLVRRVEIKVTGLAGFLLAKTAAARDRRKPKDWYDIAFVLLSTMPDTRRFRLPDPVPGPGGTQASPPTSPAR